MKKVLLIDDDKNLLYSMERVLGKKYALTTAENGGEALKALEDNDFAIVLLDIRLGSESGLELLKSIKKQRPETPVVMLTAHGTNSSVIESISTGAEDFLTKPVSVSELFDCIEKFGGEDACGNDDIILDKLPINPDEFVGVSKAVRNLLKTAGTVSQQDYPVLITGETGTGKDMVAKLIHNHSNRKSGPFISINCAAIPENLLESEFFGYVKGAFTGADQPKAGKFEAAKGGTIMLDEIGDMPLGLQSKLLKVLQEKTFERLGDNKSIKTDVRIIAATNQNIREKINAGLFRADLFFRLNVIDIIIPPLRERKEDIIPLAIYFAKLYSSISGKPLKCIKKEAVLILETHQWPGNVRELQNAVKKAVTLSCGSCLGEEDFSFKANNNTDHVKNFAATFCSMQDALDTAEKYFIEQTLLKTNGHLGEAASILNISRVTLNEKRKKYEI